jgi:hypothetical protein
MLPIAIDTTGLVPEGEGQWRDQSTQDGVAVDFTNSPLNEPFWLEDLDAARRKLAHDYGQLGCLVEADSISFGGVPAMYQLIKIPAPGRPTGVVFLAIVFVAKATCYAQVTYRAEEGPTTGVREAVVMDQLGIPDDWVRPHPYAPDVRSKLPYIRGDDPGWDAQFPDHPLTRARAWVRRAARTARVHPTFAELPTYRPQPSAQ